MPLALFIVRAKCRAVTAVASVVSEPHLSAELRVRAFTCDDSMSQKLWREGKGEHFNLVRYNEPLILFGRGDLEAADKIDGKSSNPNYVDKELLAVLK